MNETLGGRTKHSGKNKALGINNETPGTNKENNDEQRHEQLRHEEHGYNIIRIQWRRGRPQCDGISTNGDGRERTDGARWRRANAEAGRHITASNRTTATNGRTTTSGHTRSASAASERTCSVSGHAHSVSGHTRSVSTARERTCSVSGHARSRHRDFYTVSARYSAPLSALT